MAYTSSAAVYDAVYRALGKDYDAEAAWVRTLVRDCNPRARTLLDVACGTGMHLARLSIPFEVAGVDSSPDMLAAARRRLPDAELTLGDMATMDLGRRFDAVTCLFSAIGYMLTTERLHAAVANMARHLSDDGVLLIEPWHRPDDWRPGSVHATSVDERDLKVTRMCRSDREGDIAVMDMHYLVATPDEGVRHFTELHEMRLWSDEEYVAAFRAAGLAVALVDDRLSGRGCFVGRSPRR